MNKSRRATLNMIANSLVELKSQLEIVRDDEQDAYDNLPESIQESERGDTMQEAVDNMEYAIDSLEEAVDYLNEVF